MVLRRTAILILFMALAWLAASGHLQAQRVFQFTHWRTPLEILPGEVFKTRHGNNPRVPKTEEEIIALARRLFVPAALVPLEAAEPVEQCGTSDLLLLTAALQNPEVSDETRRVVDMIMQDPIPDLPNTEIFGHFRFHWTEDNTEDERHNVTRNQIVKTANYLKRYWNQCVRTLQVKPLHKVESGQELIDVKVFFSPSYAGMAINNEIAMHLCSKKAVRKTCRRQTVSAHELFHMVQFACGTDWQTENTDWLVEGSAVWAEKWLLEAAAVPPVYNYILEMNNGLDVPGRALLASRAYDAAHFWVYLTEQAGWEAMRSVLKRIKSQKTKNFKAAVNLVTNNYLQLNFDKFTHQWFKANYIKKLLNADPKYDYTEDGQTFTSCNQNYTLGNLTTNKDFKIRGNKTKWTILNSVSPYGAYYYEIELDPTVTKVHLQAAGEANGNFSFWFLGVKNDRGRKTVQTFKNVFDYNQTLNPGQWDLLVVMVMGRSKGGSFTVESNPPEPCLTGHWQTLTKSMDLVQDGSIISGVTVYGETISGTYNPPNVTWTETVDNPPANSCYPLTITATVNSDCNELNGTLQQADKPNCGQTRTFKAWKEY